MSDTATDGTPASSETVAQGQSVQGELDALINEGKTQQQPDLTKKIDKVVSYVEADQAEKFNQRFRTDMDATVKAVEEVLPEEARKFLTADMIEGQLYKRAEDDEAIRKAFLDRHGNPEAWSKAKDGIVKEFKERFKDIPDPNVNEDREAVMAAAKPTGKSGGEEELSLEQVDELRRTNPVKWQELQMKHGVAPYGQ